MDYTHKRPLLCCRHPRGVCLAHETPDVFCGGSPPLYPVGPLVVSVSVFSLLIFLDFSQAVVRAFFAGEFNCLVATCIAEEGLDIGEVDLIVSFDALNSPVRMVQRMGRTGRKRAGKVGEALRCLLL